MTLASRITFWTICAAGLMSLTLQPGASLVQPVPKEYNAFAYVLEGGGLFGAEQERGDDGQMVLFAQDGGEVTIRRRQGKRLKPLCLSLFP